MILPRGSRERVSLLNCVLFPSFVKNFFFFFFCFFFFDEFRYKKLATILKFFYFKVAQEKFHEMYPRGGGKNKNTGG